jgi:transposase InsO family protein
VSRGEPFALIASEKTKYGVRRLCRVLGVSKTAFYDWAARDGGPTTQEVAEAHAAHELHAAWAEHRRVYGARRLTAEIRDRGHDWARKRVARLMSVARVEGAHRRRRGKRARASDCPAPAPDRVGRQFTVAEPDRLWVGDITYLRSWEGFLYLAVVMDACSRRVVGWAMATHLRRELVLDAVGMAIFTRKPAPGLVHHSDRGSQGGFNPSSQHLDREVCAWDGRGVGLRWRRGGLRCGRRVARRWRVVSIDSGSGRRSLAAPRARTPGSGLACRQRSARDGFVRLAECHPQTSSHTVAAISRSRSAKRLPSCAPTATAFARSPNA